MPITQVIFPWEFSKCWKQNFHTGLEANFRENRKSKTLLAKQEISLLYGVFLFFFPVVETLNESI